MVHILILILKILGFVLLGLLGLILLLALILLLCPVVYRGRITVHDTPESVKAAARFRWLFRLVSCEVRYGDGTLKWRVRAGWKKFGSGGDSAAGAVSPEPAVNAEEETPGPEGESEEFSKAEAQAEETPEPETRPESAEIPKGEEQTEPERIPEPEPASEPEQKKLRRPDGKRRERKRKLRDPRGFFSGIREKIRKLLEKIKYTFQKICDKIRALKKKKDALTEFIEDEIHQNAFRRLVRELRRLLRFLKPDHAEIEVEFGFSDPAYTGYTLAAVSMLWPAVGGCTTIRPDFERRILRGSAEVRGKVRGGYALILLWNLIWDKNVRTTFRHVRKLIK